MEDWAQVMRRLWHGEVIFNHDGPMGKYNILFLDPDFKEDIRLALVAFGPNTLALGGRAFDDVILHTYFTRRRCSAASRPSSRPPKRLAATQTTCGCGRASPPSATIFPNSCGSRRRLRDWLPTCKGTAISLYRPIIGIRCAATVPGRPGGYVDRRRNRPQGHARADRAHRDVDSRRVAGAVGHRVSRQCVDRIRKEFEYGADAVIMHGATPDELEPIVAQYRA